MSKVGEGRIGGRGRVLSSLLYGLWSLETITGIRKYRKQRDVMILQQKYCIKFGVVMTVEFIDRSASVRKTAFV